jgi:DNA-binding beta-propeller fold protein YncE
MKYTMAILVVWLGCYGGAAHSQDTAPLRLIQTITMDPSVEGKFDHMAVDIKGGRLFLTAPKHHSIEVFDLKSGRSLHSVTGLGKPAGIVYLPASNQVLFSDGEPGSCAILDASTYQVVGSVKLAADADSMGFDEAADVLYVVNGGKDINEKYSRLSAVDIKTRKNAADIKIDGETLEAIALEKAGPRIFVNVAALNKVVVIDRASRKIIATWDVTAAKDNVSMGLDEPDHRLFLATRSPGMLLVLDSDSGKLVASVPAVGGVDDLAYDAQHKRIYMSGAEGFVNVYQQKDADTYESLAKIPTGAGARNSKFIPEQNRLYVAVPASKGKPAELQVFEVNP